jgi:hypothetical protein
MAEIIPSGSVTLTFWGFEPCQNLVDLIEAHRCIFNQERVYQRVKALMFALLFGFGRRTLTQLLMTLGLTQSDWSSWYWIFS